MEDIQYYIPENENMAICYIANNKETERDRKSLIYQGGLRIPQEMTRREMWTENK